MFFVQPLQGNYDLNEMLGVQEQDDGKPVVDVGEYKLGVATMAALPRGVDVKAIDSTNAQSTFEPFMSAFLKQVGAAVNIPYEVLMKNFTASYSASRAALLQAADEFPVFEQFLAEAVALGRIDAPGFFDDPIKRAAWSQADWYNEASHLLDVTKEVEGARMRIALGLSTHAKEAAELCGVDFADNLETLANEFDLKKKFLPAVVDEETQQPTNDDIDRAERADTQNV